MTRIKIGRKLLQGFGALGAGFLTYKAVSSEEGLDIYRWVAGPRKNRFYHVLSQSLLYITRNR